MQTCIRLWGIWLAGSLALFAQSEGFPNIILMMGDDHGWEETGYHGHPHVKTPVLDAMARESIRLERFYAGHPNCSPTRASFLTGRHPNRMGTFAPGWSFRPEEITIARLASSAGYYCGHYGKWHVGAVKAESPLCPGAMGFHEWLSHDNFFELHPTLSRNGAAPEKIEGESSKVLIDEAIAGIARAQAQQKPFFQIIWFGSPHEPYSGLPDDLALYDDLPAKYAKQVSVTSNETGAQVKRPQGEVLRERYAEITAMDRAIGDLRNFLREQKLRDNTLVFYCGDNGTSPDAALGEPHRGEKGDIYEGGVLVPGIIEWPAKFQQPKTISVRASTLDLLPTIAAIIHQPLPERPLDGINLLPAIEGSVSVRSKPLPLWIFPQNALGKENREPYIDPKLQEGTTPLVKLMDNKPTRDFVNYRYLRSDTSHFNGPRAIIDGDYKLVMDATGKSGVQLFDLASDPSEKVNLAKREPEKVEALREKLQEWQVSVLKSLAGADYQ